MTCKFIIISIMWSVIDMTTGGAMGMESDHHHHLSVAKSYMHFHGPVEGKAFEVKIPYFEHHHSEHNHLHDDHHDHGIKYVYDYTAHPKYEYKYGVEDYKTGDFKDQKETREGDSVTGEYSILEPGGRYRTVKYKADKDGFHAEVHHTGKNEHHYTEKDHGHYQSLEKSKDFEGFGGFFN